ncbi:MAG TPA: hypothetical protein PKH10_06385 [bacterium]|nr:hypothetical protein [bacterium]
MRKVLILLALVVVSLALSAEEKKAKLAVFDTTDKSKKFSKERLIASAEFIRGEIIASNQFIVIPKERQDKILIKEQKKESYKECYDQKCQIPLGQALSADTIVVPTITLFDGIYTLRLEMIDLAKEATVNGATVDFTDQKNFRDSARKAVQKLLGLEVTETVKEEVRPKEEETRPVREDNRYPGENFDASKFSEPILDDWVFFFQDKKGKYYYNRRTILIHERRSLLLDPKERIEEVSAWVRIVNSSKVKEEKRYSIACESREVHPDGYGYASHDIPITPESFLDYLHSKICSEEKQERGDFE